MPARGTLFTSQQSPKVARENGRKGGIKSGETKRQKKQLKDILTQLMEMPTSKNNKDKLKQLGIKDEEMSNLTMFAVSLFLNGCKGKTKAIDTLIDYIGDSKKKDLENEKLKEEIAILRLEQKKLKQDLGEDNQFEDLQTLADLLKLPQDKKDKNNADN